MTQTAKVRLDDIVNHRDEEIYQSHTPIDRRCASILVGDSTCLEQALRLDAEYALAIPLGRREHLMRKIDSKDHHTHKWAIEAKPALAKYDSLKDAMYAFIDTIASEIPHHDLLDVAMETFKNQEVVHAEQESFLWYFRLLVLAAKNPAKEHPELREYLTKKLREQLAKELREDLTRDFSELYPKDNCASLLKRKYDPSGARRYIRPF